MHLSRRLADFRSRSRFLLSSRSCPLVLPVALWLFWSIILMDESLFSVRGKKTLIQRERERERESVGESSKELKSPEHSYRRLWSMSRGTFSEYWWWLCIDSSPQRLPIIKRISFLSSHPSLPSLFSFLLSIPPSVSPFLTINLLFFIYIRLSQTFSPYREHIKKTYSAAVNHTHPIFSGTRWDEERTAGSILSWFMQIYKGRAASDTDAEVQLFEILCCINVVARPLQGLMFGWRLVRLLEPK